VKWMPQHPLLAAGNGRPGTREPRIDRQTNLWLKTRGEAAPLLELLAYILPL
jgi:hypothetical protein